MTNLTPEEKRGQELFGRRCGLCHSLEAANAVARVGPDLDALAPNEQFTLDAILKGRSNGNGQMPANIYTGQDAEDVAKFVAKSVGAGSASRPAVDVKSTSVQVFRPLVRSRSVR